LYENAVAANENAKLSIMKQGEVVSCLKNLSIVLRMELNVTTQGVDALGSGQPSSTTQASDHGTTSIPRAISENPLYLPSSAVEIRSHVHLLPSLLIKVPKVARMT
jgi:hypothetical protein